MRKRYNYLVIAWAMLCTIQCFGQVEAYEYRTPILQAKTGWNALSLPLDIYSKTNKILSDIRIYRYDEGSNKSIEQPYIKDIQTSKKEKIEVDFKIINPTKTNGRYTYTFELSNIESVNLIHLNFVNRNFDWNIHLEGSMDQNSWSTIVEKYRIVSLYNKETNFSYTDISIPESKFNFYRISFNSDINVILKGGTISKEVKTSSNYNVYSLADQKTSEDDKRQITTIDLDLGKKMPVSQVSLNCNSKIDYYRPFKIEGVTDSFKTEKGWHYKYILLYNGTVNSIYENVFDFDVQLLQKLKITIQNFDNQPLTFDNYEVQGPNYRLITRLDDSENIFLCYGNENATNPIYDISYFKDKIPNNLNAATLGDASYFPLKDKGSGPFFKNKLWLWGIMLLVIMLLGFFTVKMLREDK